MATDKSEPQVGMIVKVGVLAIATLIGTHEGLVAYFDHVASAEEYRKVGSATPEALLSVRADEERRLELGPVPIEKAMQLLATKGRMAADPAVRPEASRDLGPLQGWTKLPHQVPGPMQLPAPASSEAAAPAGAERGTKGVAGPGATQAPGKQQGPRAATPGHGAAGPSPATQPARPGAHSPPPPAPPHPKAP